MREEGKKKKILGRREDGNYSKKTSGEEQHKGGGRIRELKKGGRGFLVVNEEIRSTSDSY